MFKLLSVPPPSFSSVLCWSLPNCFFSSVLTTDTCQPWRHQPASRQWISITHCPHRCLPSRSPPPIPAMPCLSLLLSTTPTLWRMTSRCCAATRCPSTMPSARSLTGSSVALILMTAGGACPPAPTGWLRKKTMRPPRSISPLEGSNQREVGPVVAGAGGDPDWTAMWPHVDTRHLGTMGLEAA